MIKSISYARKISILEQKAKPRSQDVVFYLGLLVYVPLDI